MYWTFTLLFAILGIEISFAVLTKMYRKHTEPMFEQDLLRTYAFSGMPHHRNYWDLKFSILRHTIAFIITAMVFYYFSNTTWLLKVFSYGYSFYTVITILRYLSRRAIVKKEVNDGRFALADCLKNPLRASMLVVVYSICANISVFILYGIRP